MLNDYWQWEETTGGYRATADLDRLGLPDNIRFEVMKFRTADGCDIDGYALLILSNGNSMRITGKPRYLLLSESVGSMREVDLMLKHWILGYRMATNPELP